MPLLDIEKAIKSQEIRSRFRLVNLASQRARQLNAEAENTVPPQSHVFTKVTTNALNEIVNHEVEFVNTEESK